MRERDCSSEWCKANKQDKENKQAHKEKIVAKRKQKVQYILILMGIN